MKVNLLLNNSHDARSGYLNIDPFATPEDQTRTICPLQDLSRLVDANEVSELVAHDVLDFWTTTEVDKVLDHWLSRLSHGGIITVSVVDLREVARAYLAGNLDLDAANSLLHGEQDGPGRSRQCALTMPVLVEVLTNKGLKVLKKRTHMFRAVVTAQRP